MIRAISFASVYVYSPQGSSAVSGRSRLLLALLKSDDGKFISKYAGRVRQQAIELPLFADFFAGSDLLIPIPGSAPQGRRTRWVAEHLALAMVREGIGRRVMPLLRRVSAVRKSATAPAGARPTVTRHYDSFAVERCEPAPDRIVLVDDVITKGRTLLAAAARVHEAFPSARISAFALVRTMGLVPGVNCLLDPCRGEIRWNRGDAQRNP